MATILVVTAHLEFREVLRDVLTAYGHEVVAVKSGELMVPALKTHHPALAIVDLEPPGTPGIHGLAELRAQAPELPVVVLIGPASTEAESRIRDLGVTDVLRKGLRLEVIMRSVTHALQHAGRPPGGASATRAPALAGKTGGAAGQPASILVVDDEPEICEMLEEFLVRRGYRVRTARSGEQALAAVEAEPPDLVLLDIYMPGMNGVEVLRRLKSPPFAASAIGVIMLTASQEKLLLDQALDLGAFDVLPKPVDLNQVELAVIAKLALRGKEGPSADG